MSNITGQTHALAKIFGVDLPVSIVDQLSFFGLGINPERPETSLRQLTIEGLESHEIGQALDLVDEIIIMARNGKSAVDAIGYIGSGRGVVLTVANKSGLISSLAILVNHFLKHTPVQPATDVQTPAPESIAVQAEPPKQTPVFDHQLKLPDHWLFNGKFEGVPFSELLEDTSEAQFPLIVAGLVSGAVTHVLHGDMEKSVAYAEQILHGCRSLDEIARKKVSLNLPEDWVKSIEVLSKPIPGQEDGPLQKVTQAVAQLAAVRAGAIPPYGTLAHTIVQVMTSHFEKPKPVAVPEQRPACKDPLPVKEASKEVQVEPAPAVKETPVKATPATPPRRNRK